MTAFLVLLVVLSFAGVAASVHLVRVDGYGPVPDRSGTTPRRRRGAGAAEARFASRSEPLRRGWDRDANAAQTR